MGGLASLSPSCTYQKFKKVIFVQPGQLFIPYFVSSVSSLSMHFGAGFWGGAINQQNHQFLRYPKVDPRNTNKVHRLARSIVVVKEEIAQLSVEMTSLFYKTTMLTFKVLIQGSPLVLNHSDLRQSSSAWLLRCEALQIVK